MCIATGLAASSQGVAIASGFLVGGVVMFAVGHRGFVGRRHIPKGDDKGHVSLDFYLPLAFLWLLAGLFLMSGGALYESANGESLPHAYRGAVRHTLTVGLMTSLILGVGHRLIPVLDRTVLPG